MHENLTVRVLLSQMPPKKHICIGSQYGWFYFGTAEEFLKCGDHISEYHFNKLNDRKIKYKTRIDSGLCAAQDFKNLSAYTRKLVERVENFIPMLDRVVTRKYKKCDGLTGIIVDGYEEGRWWTLAEWKADIDFLQKEYLNTNKGDDKYDIIFSRYWNPDGVRINGNHGRYSCQN